VARTIAAGLQTAIARKTGSQFVHLVALHFAGAHLYVTDASQDIVTTTPAQTWTAVGGAMQVGPVEETLDAGATAWDVGFSGVDQGIIASILLDEWRGQAAEVYLCHFETTGAVTADPLRVFAGRMAGGWKIETAVGSDGHETTVKVSTRCNAYAAELATRRGRQTNPASHARVFPNDAGAFGAVALAASKTVSWGMVPRYIPTSRKVGRWRDRRPHS
jgi:hypothetical protein